MRARLRVSLLALLVLPALLTACDAGELTYPCGDQSCATGGTPSGGGSSGGGAGGSSGTQSNGSVATLSGDLKTVLDLTNTERAKVGRKPLVPNTQLMQAASLTNRQLISSGIWAHVMPGTPYPQPTDRIDATSYHWLKMGENIGRGMDATPDTMVQVWVNSPSHYENLIDADFTEIGLAIDTAPDGTVYMTQELALPRVP
jgi:uncharacterized protein YkwD